MILPQQDLPRSVREAMGRRGRAVIRSQGPSMLPAIPDGSLLDVRPVVFEELAPGDVVVYHRGGELYCHRLIGTSGRNCIVKGDALLTADPPVAWPQVLGRVAVIIADGERFIPLDHPEERRRARRRARMSYPHALLHRILTTLRRAMRKEPRK